MAELKGSKTEKNLETAFAGESMARNKYTYFASKARKDGYVQIANIFEETANNEKEHAKMWFKLINGGICLDNESRELTVDGEPVLLTPIEYSILLFLMRAPGKVFSSAEIYRAVWKEEPLGSDGAVAVHIRHLREKIEINPSEPRYLKVIWGQGYKMEVQK